MFSLPKLAIWILIISIIAGQLIKLPQGNQSGLTLLDISVLFLDIIFLFTLKFHLPSTPKWVKVGIIFISLSFLSLLLTPLKLSQQEIIISSLYIFRFLTYFLLGWLLLSPQIAQISKTVPLIFIISTVVMAVLGLIQFIFIPDMLFLAEKGWDPHYFRTVSTLLDPNFMGTFFALILITLFLQGRKLMNQKLTIIIFIIVYIALITTFSRGAALIFFTSFLALSIIKKSPKLILFTILLTAGFALSFFRYTQDVAEPRNIDRRESAEFRLNSWQEGLTLFQKYPLLGVGFNTYRYALRENNLASEGVINSRGGSANDSSLIFVAATTGVTGLATYLYFLFTLLQSSWNNHKKGNIWGTIFFTGLLGLLVQSFFANSLFYPWFLIWIFLTSSHLGGGLGRTPRDGGH